MAIEYANINYDVPMERRSAYSKLRALFRRKAIMQTASSYLFPWGIAQQIQDGLETINKDSDGLPLPARLHVRYSIFKYDDEVSGAALEQSARDALARMLRHMKETVNKKVHELRAAGLLDDHPDDKDGKDPFKTARASCAKARATARDCRALALAFNLMDDMEVGTLAFEAWIEVKRNLINDLEEEADALKKTEEGENVTPLEKFKDSLQSTGCTD